MRWVGGCVQEVAAAGKAVSTAIGCGSRGGSWKRPPAAMQIKSNRVYERMQVGLEEGEGEEGEGEEEERGRRRRRRGRGRRGRRRRGRMQ